MAAAATECKFPEPESLRPGDAMEIDVRSLSQRVVHDAEVCVVGAGPVGLALTCALRDRGVDVVLIEHGPVQSDPSAGASHPGDGGHDAEGGAPSEYGPLAGTRGFGVGGTATIWNTVLRGRPMAKYAALSASDLEERAWIPHSGWPIDWASLDRWYDDAHAYCGLAPRTTNGGDTRGCVPLELDGTGLETGVYHYGPAARFTHEIPARLASDDGVPLLLGASLSGLRRSAADGRVHEATWSSAHGIEGIVQASTFVLAAGAIENARILLAARETGSPLDDSPWTGRGFMEHPIDTTLELTTRLPALAPPGGFYSQHTLSEDETIVGRIALSDDLLASEKIPRASIRLFPSEGPRALVAGTAPRVARRIVPFPAARRVAGRAVRGLWRSSRPLVGARYRLWIDMEQVPSPENRVVLSSRKDGLGRPAASLTWRWSAGDESLRQRTLRAVCDALERAEVGLVRRAEDGNLDPRAHHHMGTTRMGSDPSHGVVDGDLRVHSSANVYVAGPSVFPTGGVANPTLTAVALALRLGHHLADRRAARA